MKLSNQQVRQFLLRRQGLLGTHIFTGKEGVMQFISLVGSLQYDPVNVCARTADITLHSRVEAYNKSHLDELLYIDRKLVDYFDKCLNIVLLRLYPILLNEQTGGGYAAVYHAQGGEAVQRALPIVRALIRERGFVAPKDIKFDENIQWFWGHSTSVARATLESMYYAGEVIIHHRRGTNKSYAFTKDYIPQEILDMPMPYDTPEERDIWHMKRRIASVGVMWDKSSDAFLGLGLNAARRAAAFKTLIKTGDIFEITVEGMSTPLYILESERALLETILAEASNYAPRTEFIAPLDSFIWDRKLIHALFGFEYRWEIYTPQVKRKYGAYTLPILHGTSLIGRIDMARKGSELIINGLWMEDGKKPTSAVKKAIDKCVSRFEKLALH